MKTFDPTVLLAWVCGALTGALFGTVITWAVYDRQKRDLQLEALKRGYATQQVSDYPKTKFVWREQ